jgi:hypothetical protein
LLLRFRKSKCQVDYDNYAKTKREYKLLLKKKERDYKKERLDTLMGNITDSKGFWKEIRKYKRKQPNMNEIPSEEWTEHFERVLNEGYDYAQNNTEDGDRETEDVFDELLDEEITTGEVRKAIKYLKNSKAAGPDEILSEMLKMAENEIIEYLTGLFNYLFTNSLFPTEWTKAIIIPIFKKGDTNKPDNYRGISLLSVLSKMYTYILNNRLTLWTESYEKITDAQAGFRKGRSTIDHIFTLNAAIERQMSKNSKLYVAFIDFRKAYDSVDRKVLWKILVKSGVSSKMIKAIQSMYDSVQACVLSNGNKSLFFKCMVGLKQGCIASPLLFSLLINDLANDILSKARHGVPFGPTEIELVLLLFADDLTLLASTVIGLQNQLNVLRESASRLGLTINLDKSKIMVFRKGGYLAAKERWFLGESLLEVVSLYKFLGLTFSTGNSFSTAMEDAAGRAKKSVYEILRALRKVNCNSPDVFFKLFDAQVVPILLYGAEIWGVKSYDKMERVHLFACKRFLHISDKTPNDVVYGELGRFPLYIDALIRVIKYWFKLLEQPEQYYSKRAYKMLLVMHNQGKATWVSNVQSILCNNGFEQVWLFGCGNKKSFFVELKSRLQSTFIHKWKNHLEQSSRLLIYSQYKSTFNMEKYVGVVWLDVYRNALAQFRTGVSQINDHKFRFNENVDKLLCPLCLSGRETEVHFLLVCPVLRNTRNKYIPTDSQRDINAQFNFLFQTECIDMIVKLGKYIFYSFQIRSKAISDKPTNE